MARPRKWKSDAERMAAKRAAEKNGTEEAPGHIGQYPQPREETPEPEEQPVVQTGAFEQALRDHYGYTASEKRTQAERKAAADRIVTAATLRGEDPYEALGQRYGEDEAKRRAETGQKREWRIERAIAYQRFLREEGRPPG